MILTVIGMFKVDMKQIILSLLLTAIILPGFAPASDMSGGDLGEVVIRADDVIVYGEKKPVNAIIASRVISSVELKSKGIRNLAQALEYTAGIDIQPVGKGESHISMRGFDQVASKVLIDGVPAYEGFFGLVDLTAIPAQAIEKIVIEKGGSSVLYGPNTMGGVVNVITRKGALIHNRETEVSFSAGDYNSRNYGISHSANLGKVNYYLGYNRRVSDGFALSGNFDNSDIWVGEASGYDENGGLREYSDYHKQSLVANIGYESGGKTRGNLSFTYLNNKHGCPVELNRYWRFTKWYQWQLSLAGEHKLSPTAVLSSRLFYVDHTDELADDIELTYEAGGRTWFDKSRYDDFSVGGDLQFRYTAGKWNLFRMGFNYQKDHNDQKEYNARDFNNNIIVGWSPVQSYEANTYNFGGEDLIRLTDRVFVTPGAAYSYFKPIKSADMPSPGAIGKFNPQIGMSVDITEKATLVTSVGRKVRFPRLKELYSTHAGGNPDLKAEQTVASETGFDYRINDFNSISVSWFRNDIEDLIERVQDGSGDWIYQNIGRALFTGLETQIRSMPVDRIRAGFSYTYLNAKNKEDDSKVACRPEQKLDFNIGYDSPAHISLALYGSFVGHQVQYYSDNGENVARTIPTYFLGNARITYKIAAARTASTELFITINNIFDKNYEEGNGPMPGRSIRAGFDVGI